MPIVPILCNYEAAENWLLSVTDYERLLGSPALQYDTQNFDLDRFRSQLTRLGNPHLKYGVIHVAGTKGKGSTCAFLESAFRACGFRTGLYTSPHLFRFTERIRINGEEIPDDDFCRLVSQMGGMMAQATEAEQDATTAAAGFRTVFEILTAAAFQHFADQQVDVAIVETGLGGRLDSTNMFDQPGAGPLVDIITTIGLDHTSILGSSIAAIAGEKAGIIRPHARVVMGLQATRETKVTVADVIRKRCTETGAQPPVMADEFLAWQEDPAEPAGRADNGDNHPRYTFRRISAENLSIPDQALPSSGDALSAALSRGLTVQPGLEGAHQAGNVATALTALCLYEAELARYEGDTSAPAGRLTGERVARGLAQTHWAGRFQVISHAGLTYVVDGAHCALSSNALGRACRARFGDQPAVIITGFLRDKAGEEILDGVFQQVPVVAGVAIAPPTPRAVSADHIQAALEERLGAGAVPTAQSMAEALALASTAAQSAGAYVVIYGSLYLVGPALTELLP